MSDIRAFARELAAQTKYRLESDELSTRAQLHRSRILDAELRPLWRSVIDSLSEGIAEYDAGLKGTLLEQTREIESHGDHVVIRWRYPSPGQLALQLDYDRRLIIAEKAKAIMELRVTVDEQDQPIITKKSGRTYSGVVIGATGAAEEILKFMLE